MSARILVLDIETAPHLAYVWSLWKNDVSLSQIQSVGQVICFAWKWRGERTVGYVSDHHDGHDSVVSKAHELLDEADIVVHWNGTKFDVPHLQREIVTSGLTPPSPFKQVDLCLAVRRQFRFASNKLDHVVQQLGIGAKLSHTGFDLWKRCMDGDDQAWSLMRRYNKRDVVITDLAYDRLLPWLPHPHVGLYDDNPEERKCGKCASRNLQRRGYTATAVGRFQQYRCNDCGSWMRSGKREDGVDVRPVAS